MNKFRIKTRLITLVAVLLALVLLTSVMGSIRLRQANASIEIIYKDRVIGRGQLANLQIDEAQREYIEAHHMVERFMVVNGVVTGLTLCVAVLTCWMLIRSITNPLSEAVKVAETVASGDLTSIISVTGRDETSELLAALKHMNDRLVDIVGRVRSSSEAIGSATKQIAAGNIDLSSRTEAAGSVARRNGGGMEQLTATVRHNADNAHHASACAGSASDIAARGNEFVGAWSERWARSREFARRSPTSLA